jgi:hypothetical protein
MFGALTEANNVGVDEAGADADDRAESMLTSAPPPLTARMGAKAREMASGPK